MTIYEKPKPLSETLPPYDYLTIKEVADILRVSPLSIKRWGRTKADFPAPIRINSRGDRRYKKELILEFLQKDEN